MKIVWSDLAKEYYLFIIEQIFEKWNIKIVELFENETVSLINKIENHNHICPKSKIINLHKCVVNHHVSLIYRVQNNVLEIVTFVYNESDHKY
jgi:plasmid stabilization system protein ParE